MWRRARELLLALERPAKNSIFVANMASSIISGGTIRTLSDGQPTVEAVGIVGDRIVATGAVEAVRSRLGPGATTFDLRGRTLLPAFNDDHLHVLSTGDYFARPHLHGLSTEEVIERVREFYRDARPGEVLYGLGWDYPSVVDPHRSLLDRAFPDNPVVLYQYSGHGAWASSSALAMIGVRRSTRDPVGGKIERDERGEPTGILLDAAARPFSRRRTRRQIGDADLRRRLIERSLGLLAEHGITTAQDNSWYPEVVREYLRLDREGKLTARLSCWADGRSPWRRWLVDSQPFALPPAERRAGRGEASGDGRGSNAGAGDGARAGLRADGRGDRGLVTRGPVKYFLDGTFSTRTAWLLSPYAAEPDNSGLPMGTIAWMRELVRRSAAARRQTAFHAIGDRAVRELVNSVEEAAARYPAVRSLRVRIEHGQLIDAADIPRIRDLGMVVSAQPTALIRPEKDERLLGKERAIGAYPYRSLLDAGVHLAFGSDVPGESTFDPLGAIHDVVNRDSPERISVLEALRCYTRGSAYAEFEEGEKGTIEPGRLADLVVLSADPLSVPPAAIRDLRVELTMVGGRVVYERSRERENSTIRRSSVTLAEE